MAQQPGEATALAFMCDAQAHGTNVIFTVRKHRSIA
jgi:hypothetical protein